MNPYDGTAAVIVPQAVEKLPLLRWRPGARLLCVGSRNGAVFDDALDREEGTTFRRPVSADLIREAARKTGVDALAATWCESLRFPSGLAALQEAAGDLPLVVASAGRGDGVVLDGLLPRTAVWSLLISGEPGPQAGRILAEGAHVEVLLGLDGSGVIPDLPWESARAIHLVPRDPAADPEARRDWYRRARAALPATVAIHDEDHQHSDCSCGERLVWRHGPKSRRDTLGTDGACTACGRPSGIIP